MGELFWDVLVSLFNTITTFVSVKYFFSIFSDKTKTSRITYLAYILFFLTPLVFNMPVINMVLLISSVFAVSLNFVFKLYNKVLFTLIFVAISGLTEIITVIIVTSLFNLTPDRATSGVFSAFGTMLSKFLCLLFCLIIGSVKNKTLIGKFKLNWISMYFLPISTFLVACVLYQSMFYYEDNTTLKNLSLVSLILLVIANVLIVRVINNIHESVINENRLVLAEELIKQQEKQYSLMFDNNEKIIKIRHDYKNFIVGLMSEVESGRFERLSDILEDELENLSNFSRSTICGISAIDTIIGYKTLEAKRKGIELKFEYKNLSGVDFPGVDMSVLLGNAIDNAIEASEALNDISKKIVVISMCVKGKQLLINVTNNVISDIDVDYLYTKKGVMHGYGIVNMKAIVKKYNGSISFSCQNKEFNVFVILNIK